MNELERFEEWAAAARADQPPQLDVTHRVIGTLRAGQAVRPGVDRLQWALCGVCMAAALVTSVVAVQAWQSVTDPAISWLLQAPSVLQ